MTRTTTTEAAAKRMISPYVFAGCFMRSPFAIVEDYNAMIEAFCNSVKLPVSTIMSKTRQRHIVAPRQALMFLLRTKCKLTLPSIAKIFGMDHTSVIHSINVVRELRSVDSNYEHWIATFEKMEFYPQHTVKQHIS